MSFSSLPSPKSFLLGVDVDFDAVDEIKSGLRVSLSPLMLIQDYYPAEKEPTRNKGMK
jgi:hypothetical protein